MDAVDTGGAPTASTLRRYSAFGVPREAAPAQSIERGFASRPIEGASGLVSVRSMASPWWPGIPASVRCYDVCEGRVEEPHQFNRLSGTLSPAMRFRESAALCLIHF